MLCALMIESCDGRWRWPDTRGRASISLLHCSFLFVAPINKTSIVISYIKTLSHEDVPISEARQDCRQTETSTTSYFIFVLQYAPPISSAGIAAHILSSSPIHHFSISSFYHPSSSRYFRANNLQRPSRTLQPCILKYNPNRRSRLSVRRAPPVSHCCSWTTNIPIDFIVTIAKVSKLMRSNLKLETSIAKHS